MIPDRPPPTSLDKPPHEGNDAAIPARVARQEATVEEVLKRLDRMQHQMDEGFRLAREETRALRTELLARMDASDKRQEDLRREFQERFEKMREESTAKFEKMRAESDARFERMDARWEAGRKESNARFERMDARWEAGRKESDARFERMDARWEAGRKESEARFETLRQSMAMEMRATQHVVNRTLIGVSVALIGLLGLTVLH